MARGGFHGKWLGGFIYWRDLGKAAPDGRVLRKRSGRTFHIVKRIGGHLYKRSTRCSSEKAAIKELERFEKDPAGYEPAGTPPEPSNKPIYLREALATSYLEWCRDIQQSTPAWIHKQKAYLSWWADQLNGVDLRKADLQRHIEPPLGPENKSIATRAKRIAVIKGLYTYLRREKHARDAGFGISVEQDPVFGTLKVPQADPNKRRIADKAIPPKDIASVIEELEGHWRDAMIVQAATGWHVTEIERFTAGKPLLEEGVEVRRIPGAVLPAPKGAKGKELVGILVCPEAKIGGELRTAVKKKEVLAAAKRLLKHGSFSVQKYGVAVKKACIAAEVEVFTPGRMRHAFATNAINQGADMAAVSTFLNHKSLATTKAFYAKFGVPSVPPTLV